MFLSKRRIVLFGVIGVLAITIILLPRIQYFVNAPDVNAIDFKLSSVNITNLSNNTNNIELLLLFDVSNLSEKSATTSKVEYDLFGDNELLGHGVLSYEDIPLNGRPQFSPGQTTTLKSRIVLQPSDTNIDIIKKLINNPDSINSIRWNVKGSSQIESAFVILQKDFSDVL
ncbi:MAG TPA: hypothetical protein VFP49_10595 [Nitrososphaeraceae archaeon]|jgi:hypothetical protein|nr:hypothetical protein [Nitrososphaeraceae archaeon]